MTDLHEFCHAIWDFACGGRIKGLFGTDWAEVDYQDRAHVCSRDRVFEYCIDWPRLHTDLFESIVQKITFLAIGDPADAERHWQAYLAKEAKDPDFEGVDTEPAPGEAPRPSKKSAR